MQPAHETGLPLTGERTLPGIPQENYWFRRHEVAYRAIEPRCAGADVLDAGCGEGYGAALLAGPARHVVAVDSDPATITHVASRYPAVTPVRADLAALPLKASSVDVVVCLQVIEHLWEQVRFLGECARVLRRSGELLVSTPNRLTFSAGSLEPVNPFHTVEYAPDELSDLLCCAGFSVVEMLGVRHGPALRALDARHGGSIVDAQVALALSGREWPAGLLADVATVCASDFEISERELAGCLDLVAVARPR